MEYKYHHLHLICSDPNKMEKWLQDTFGARTVERRMFGTAPGMAMDVGGVPIYLRAKRDDEQSHGDASGMRYAYDHLGLGTTDFDGAIADLRKKGVEFVQEPSKTPSGYRICFIKGPDNVRFEILESH